MPIRKYCEAAKCKKFFSIYWIYIPNITQFLERYLVFTDSVLDIKDSTGADEVYACRWNLDIQFSQMLMYALAALKFRRSPCLLKGLLVMVMITITQVLLIRAQILYSVPFLWFRQETVPAVPE